MSGNKLLAAVLALLLLTACGRHHSMLPASGGKPYEVLVVGDLDGLLTSELTRPVAGLPQEEPCFDVSAVSAAHYNQASRLARNIVLTDIDASRHTAIRLRYEQDVYAHPQLIVTIEAPSLSDLHRQLAAVGSRLRKLLSQAETARYITAFEERHGTAESQKAAGQFGLTLLLPPEFSASKQADGFLWISDDGKASQRSICLYTLPLGTDLTAGRDSVMALHLPGEREGMHVGTAQVLPAETVHTPTGDRKVIRGLWEMKGDVMGGPFVLHAIADSTRHRLVVAEALLFAPGMAKRNEMRRLEAILHTLQPVRQ